MRTAAQPQAMTAAREHWIDVCALDDLVPQAGAAALVGEDQAALFRVGDAVHAVDNFDPFSKAYVIARGIVGDTDGRPFVASPMHKHKFDLHTGQSLDDPSVSLRVWRARVRQGRVEIRP